MMLVDKDWSANFDLALMVFEDRTRPHLKRAFDFGVATDQPRFEVDLCGDEHWLTDNWTKVFLPVLDQHFAQLLSLTTEQISRVYRSLRGLNPESSFDPISFSRSAIEPHEQDSHRDPIDVLIDAARDSIEAALSQSLPIGEGYLEVWRSSPCTILRRLAVHGWRVRSDIGPDEKLAWLLGQDLLWESPLQHEVFLLIQDTLPNASDDVARNWLTLAVAGPPGDDESTRPTGATTCSGGSRPRHLSSRSQRRPLSRRSRPTPNTAEGSIQISTTMGHSGLSKMHFRSPQRSSTRWSAKIRLLH